MRSNKVRLKEKCVKLAMDIYLAQPDNKRCEMCGSPATVAHHIIHQSRSNYLRCSMQNLCALDNSCHYKVHSCGSEGILMGMLIKKRGVHWFDTLVADSHKSISDTVGYWEEMYAKLRYVQEQLKKGDLP